MPPERAHISGLAPISPSCPVSFAQINHSISTLWLLLPQVAKGPVRVGAVNANGAITIKDVSAAGAAAAAGGGSAGEQPADAAMEADEDYARRLQAKMDAQAMGGNK